MRSKELAQSEGLVIFNPAVGVGGEVRGSNIFQDLIWWCWTKFLLKEIEVCNYLTMKVFFALIFRVVWFLLYKVVPNLLCGSNSSSRVRGEANKKINFFIYKVTNTSWRRLLMNFLSIDFTESYSDWTFPRRGD